MFDIAYERELVISVSEMEIKKTQDCSFTFLSEESIDAFIRLSSLYSFFDYWSIMFLTHGV